MILPSSSPLTWGYRSRPLPTEIQSGDAHIVAPFPDGVLLAVIDGLGHGPEAASASEVAMNVLVARPACDPAALVGRCHDVLRGSRGVAMLVVSLSFPDASARWVGVGNVEGWHVTHDRRVALLSSAGVVGYQISPPRTRQANLGAGDLFVLATDGISAGFTDEICSGREPDEMAGAILAKYARVTDDAHVLVARYDAR